MSSRKFVTPLQIDLFASRSLLYALLLFHLLALGALYFVALPMAVLALLGAMLLLSAFNSIRLHAFRKSRKSVVRLIWEDNGHWYFVRRSGEKTRVKFKGDSFCNPWLTVLNFKVPDKWFSQSVIIAKDNANAELHRRLRSRLKTDLDGLLE